MLYHPETGKIWGAQSVGFDGVDKRIDVVSAFISKEGTVHDLAEFEQAYAPPFSSAKDPVNMVGFIAENALAGYTKIVTWRDVAALAEKGAFLLDVRSRDEFALGSVPGAYNIPHTELRSRFAEVPRNRTIAVNCAIGLRGYLAERMLRQNGYTDVVNLTGGYKTWHAATSELKLIETGSAVGLHSGAAPSGSAAFADRAAATDDGSPQKKSGKSVAIDACGLQCPGPIIRLKKEIGELEEGDRLSMKATDPGFARDVKSWCELTGNVLVSIGTENGIIDAVIEKGAAAEAANASHHDSASQNGATFIVFSNDLDKALASFVLANGAAATGKEVTMFFTFWGLSVLRKKTKGVKKDFMGKMFGMMLPKSMKSLALSSMNFGGAGPLMMKSRMKAKNVDQLESMYAQARMAGVRMIACQMSMDIMGISAEELLDGVEIGGVATYMAAAAKSGVNLFI